MSKRRFALINSVGGLSDAPSDGLTYGRKDGAWVIINTDTVTVSGGTLLAATRAGTISIKDLKFDQDGNVFDRESPGAYGQISSAEDWVRPTGNATTFQIRFINPTGDTGALSSTGTVDVWFTLSTSDFVMTVADNSAGDGASVVTFTIEIRLGTGSVLDSGSYTLSADRTS